VLQKDIEKLTAAVLHDTHTKIRKLKTARGRSQDGRSAAKVLSFSFGCAGTNLAMWMYISSSVVPKRNDFNLVRVYFSFPGLKKIIRE
jgi:hypothetical protein